jgi:TRAP-type mannitol/chloroaromatic compound transport system substrate-binding protein
MHIIGMLMRAAIAAAATSILAVPASAQSFRMATSWGGGPHLEVMAKGFASNAAQLTDGKVKFEVFPAGTIGSPLKVTETVQKKVAQAGHHWSGYDYGLDKTAVLFGGYAGSMPAEHYIHWLYEGGGVESCALRPMRYACLCDGAPVVELFERRNICCEVRRFCPRQ